MTDKVIEQLAEEYACGSSVAEQSFIAGYEAALQSIPKEDKPSLLFYCQSAIEGDVHCIQQCKLCKPGKPKEDNEAWEDLANKELPVTIQD